MENQYKNAILTKENVYVKCFRKAMLYIQILNTIHYFFRKKNYNKIRHLNFKIISLSGRAECSLRLISDDDHGEGGDGDGDGDAIPAGGGRSTLTLEGVYNLTLVEINIFSYSYFEFPGVVVHLLINTLNYTINKYEYILLSF